MSVDDSSSLLSIFSRFPIDLFRMENDTSLGNDDMMVHSGAGLKNLNRFEEIYVHFAVFLSDTANFVQPAAYLNYNIVQAERENIRGNSIQFFFTSFF